MTGTFTAIRCRAIVEGRRLPTNDHFVNRPKRGLSSLHLRILKVELRLSVCGAAKCCISRDILTTSTSNGHCAFVVGTTTSDVSPSVLDYCAGGVGIRRDLCLGSTGILSRCRGGKVGCAHVKCLGFG